MQKLFILINQKDVHELLVMIIDVIDKGSKIKISSEFSLSSMSKFYCNGFMKSPLENPLVGYQTVYIQCLACENVVIFSFFNVEILL